MARAPNASYERTRKRTRLERGPTGRIRCRWCGTEVDPPRRTFCSDACVHEYKLRSNPGYLRRLVFQRDRGVCAACGVDTEALRRSVRALRTAVARRARCATLRFPVGRLSGSWWDADHILAVEEGGGECDLSNIQTLCVPCHVQKTAEHARRRADRRKP